MSAWWGIPVWALPYIVVLTVFDVLVIVYVLRAWLKG